MNKIEIKYNGEYPCLCMGHLEVWINDVYYDFGEYCLTSGGSVTFNDEWKEEVEDGCWSINEYPKDFPEEYKDELLNRINEEIPHGCCGGCV